MLIPCQRPASTSFCFSNPGSQASLHPGVALSLGQILSLLFIYTHVYTHIHIYIYIYTHISYIYICTYTCMCVVCYIYIYTYIYIYICLILVYISICTYNPAAVKKKHKTFCRTRRPKAARRHPGMNFRRSSWKLNGERMPCRRVQSCALGVVRICRSRQLPI